MKDTDLSTNGTPSDLSQLRTDLIDANSDARVNAAPINLGIDELATINGLVEVIEEAVGVELDQEYDLTKPQRGKGRNSDNVIILNELGWEPSTAL